MFNSSEKFKRKHIIKFLRNTPPEKFINRGINKVIPTFQKAARMSPAYADFLHNKKINPQTIQSIDEFSRSVPILNKESFFNKYSLPEILGSNINKLKVTMTSSGFSNNFGFGFYSHKALKSSRLGTDATLDYWFNISEKKSFLINCLAMGVQIDTSLCLAATSVRPDMILALIKKVSPQFEQTILVGDPYFLKNVIEQGEDDGLNWPEYNINIVTGQDWLPESLRTYLANKLAINLEKDSSRGIFTTMGMTELGLNVFHESHQSVKIRRTLLKEPLLKEKITQSTMKAPPYIFHYYPMRTHIETIPSSTGKELIFTVLDKNSIAPMIRYVTGDHGELMDFRELEEILTANYSSLIPDLKLPLGIIGGRKTNTEESTFQPCIEDIKEALYTHEDIATRTTGLIGIKSNKDHSEIQIHLKANVKSSEKTRKQVEQFLSDFTNKEFKVNLINYYEFTNALTLDFERKLKI